MEKKDETKPLVTIKKEIVRQERWYFGGLAGILAACCTHPLDTLKVQLQTQQRADYGLISMAAKVIRDDGFLALYNGLSASCLRQATYTTTRFAIYGSVRSLRPNSNLSFIEKISLAAVSGAVGAFVGAPADLVNVRMQNDPKLPKEQRRNYKHAIDGIVRICREEGPKKLLNGASMAVIRGAFVTVGQIAFYEQVKQVLLASGYFKDNIITHFTSSFAAGAGATLLTMPLDVMKTRMMNAPPGTYNSLLDCFKDIMKDAIVIAADSRCPAGDIIFDDNVLNIYRLSDNIYALGAGTSADCDFQARLLESQLELFKLNQDRQVRVATAVTKIQQHLFRHQGYLGAYLIIVDVDVTGSHMATVHPHRSISFLPFVASGSGGYTSLSVIEDRYKANIIEDETKQLIHKFLSYEIIAVRTEKQADYTLTKATAEVLSINVKKIEYDVVNGKVKATETHEAMQLA
ncbi:unnamed protein product [Rotaria sp. Silwood2]|nr:unnamed protein product [Rotaria sp. Silwood2]